ncbi:MAG: ACT domain-containing protein [Victivallales bacterium]|nr:ACT domain-containing protein [Victivallales bacterium]
MIIKQLSIFLENKSGRIHEITEILGRENLNIHALSLADSENFGVLRLIVNDLDKSLDCLKKNGVATSLTSVLAVEVPDKPGGLAAVMKVIDDAGLNIEYMYSIPEKTHDNAIMIMRFDNTEQAVNKLDGKGLRILTQQEVLKL